jgi:hypothetical protein
MRWKTDEVVALLEDPRYKITTTNPGGDVDTTKILMLLKDAEGDYPETLFISGFVTGMGWVTNPDDWDVEMVEVSDGKDSSGGLNSPDTEFCAMYAHAVSKLRQAGFIVVPCMKDYF